MKGLFYPKLAWSGIHKNRRLYWPYLLTASGVVMMFYIIAFLASSDRVQALRGGNSAVLTLRLGIVVMAVFALIFRFYANSFLIRRRKKEFGLYNILGMDKRHIGRLLLCETLLVALFTLAAGLFFGIAFSKLAELCLIRLLKQSAAFTLTLSPTAILQTLLVFGVIYFLTFLNTLRQIHFSNPIALLRSENTGEKPPKANWLLGLLGFLLLGVAYFIAIRITNPLDALFAFLIAVLLVIAGTYLLFIAGSVLFCRLLQRSKRYYYRANHFVSLSSMVYRMKRNGAGLASICILATMVLVMISSTSSLYFGIEETLHLRYPRDVSVALQFDDLPAWQKADMTAARQAIGDTLQEESLNASDVLDYRSASSWGRPQGNSLVLEDSTLVLKENWLFFFISLDDYNRCMGQNETLAEDEVLLYAERGSFTADSVTLPDGSARRVKQNLTAFWPLARAGLTSNPVLCIVVPDLNATVQSIQTFVNSLSENSDYYIALDWRYSFNCSEATIDNTSRLLTSVVNSSRPETFSFETAWTDSIAENRADFYGSYGGLFFLGILLSLVFLCGAVLILYYKQISEGYEDQMRFDIMQKVGMTRREIRQSINSQLLTVFFLPLLMAGLHLTFAFPMLRRIILLFGVMDSSLLAWTTVISFAVFSLFYTLVYKFTSNSYYRIVA